MQTTVLPAEHVVADQGLPQRNANAPVATTQAPTGNSVGDGGPHNTGGQAPTEQDETVVQTREFMSARDALRANNAALALSLADSSARAHPHGVLEHELERVAIDALVRLGRNAEAVARADRFLAAHPTSTQGPLIRALRTRAAPATPTPAPAQ